MQVTLIVYWIAIFLTGLLPAVALAMVLFKLSALFSVRLIIEAAMTTFVSAVVIINQTSPFDPVFHLTHLVLPVVLVLRVGDRIGRALMRPRNYFQSDTAYEFRRFLRYGFLLLFMVAVLPRLTNWFPFTFFFSHPEQDACEFGSVTDAEYREMLAKARSIQRWTWPPLDKMDQTGGTHSDYLENQITEIAEPQASLDRKLAARHAVHRALGAIYLNDNGSPNDWSYTLAVPRLGVFAVLPGNAWMPGGIRVPGEYSNAQGIRAIIHFPNLLDIPPSLIPDGLFRSIPNACPRR